MSELSDESKALLETEGPLDEPTPAEIEAMHARVVAALGPLAGPAPPTAPSTTLAGKSVAASSMKLIGSTVAAAVGSGALLFALNQPVSRAPAPAPAVTPIAPATVPAPPFATAGPLQPPSPAPQVSSPPSPPATPRVVKPAATAVSEAPRSASEEALLVAAAEAQLRSGHASAALALFERHLLEYPKGALRRESQTGRVIALCGMGRDAEVRAEVERFVARFPGSPTAARMQRACGFEP